MTTALKPQRVHHYTTVLFDSARWEGFEHRPGDILVCTAYKAGTTWTQMICALLIFQRAQLDRPLSEISPWLEMEIRPVDEAFATLAGQSHRRFIKSHTPLDGLPWWDDATYLFVGRDPRDILLSMVNHKRNINPEATAAMVARKLGIPKDQVPPSGLRLPEDVNDLARMWLSQGSFPWEEDGFPFWSVFNHARTFWEFRHLPNIHFLHYGDLQADLAGQMRRLAGLLSIDVPENRWPALVEAAGFASMRDNADMTAPDAHLDMWRDNKEFFHKGTTGQWRDGLSPETLALFETVMAERMPPALSAWMCSGSRGEGDPKSL